MKILVIHNSYKVSGGENQRVEEDMLLYKSIGINAYLYTKENDTSFLSNFISVITSPLNLFVYFELNKIIKNFKPDIIHIHNTWYKMGFAVYLVIKKNKIPTFQTLHNLRFFCANALMFRNGKDCSLCLNTRIYSVVHNCYKNRIISLISSLNNFLIIKSNVFSMGNFKFFSPNPYVDSLMSNKLNINPKKILKFPNYVDDFMKLENKIIREVDNFFLIVSRKSDEKGVSEFLEKWENLNLQFNLVIVGGINKQIKINTDKIRFYSNIDKEQLAYFYQNCIGVIIPSTWREGFPRVLIEAASVNKPIIASNTIEITKSEDLVKFCFIFDHKNTISIKNSIDLAYSRSQENKINSREWYLNFYTETKYLNYLISSYRELINEVNKN